MSDPLLNYLTSHFRNVTTQHLYAAINVHDLCFSNLIQHHTYSNHLQAFSVDFNLNESLFNFTYTTYLTLHTRHIHDYTEMYNQQ